MSRPCSTPTTSIAFRSLACRAAVRSRLRPQRTMATGVQAMILIGPMGPIADLKGKVRDVAAGTGVLSGCSDGARLVAWHVDAGECAVSGFSEPAVRNLSSGPAGGRQDHPAPSRSQGAGDRGCARKPQAGRRRHARGFADLRAAVECRLCRDPGPHRVVAGSC